MTAGNMIFLYFRKLKPLGFFKCLSWTKTMKTVSIYPGAIWNSCFVHLGRLSLRWTPASLHLSGRLFDLEQNAICHRPTAVEKNSNHELVSLKMSSLKLVILWGGQKVRNLRLSLNKGVLVHLEDGSFFLFLTKAPDFKLTYPLQYQERPYISHSPSSLTRPCIRSGETISDGLQRRMHLYNRPSFSSAFKTYTCAFSSLGEWGGIVLFLFIHFSGKSYKSILRQSGLLFYSYVFSPG